MLSVRGSEVETLYIYDFTFDLYLILFSIGLCCWIEWGTDKTISTRSGSVFKLNHMY